MTTVPIRHFCRLASLILPPCEASVILVQTTNIYKNDRYEGTPPRMVACEGAKHEKFRASFVQSCFDVEDALWDACPDAPTPVYQHMAGVFLCDPTQVPDEEIVDSVNYSEALVPPSVILTPYLRAQKSAGLPCVRSIFNGLRIPQEELVARDTPFSDLPTDASVWLLFALRLAFTTLPQRCLCFLSARTSTHQSQMKLDAQILLGDEDLLSSVYENILNRVAVSAELVYGDTLKHMPDALSEKERMDMRWSEMLPCLNLDASHLCEDVAEVYPTCIRITRYEDCIYLRNDWLDKLEGVKNGKEQEFETEQETWAAAHDSFMRILQPAKERNSFAWGCWR